MIRRTPHEIAAEIDALRHADWAGFQLWQRMQASRTAEEIRTWSGEVAAHRARVEAENRKLGLSLDDIYQDGRLKAQYAEAQAQQKRAAIESGKIVHVIRPVRDRDFAEQQYA